MEKILTSYPNMGKECQRIELGKELCLNKWQTDFTLKLRCVTTGHALSEGGLL